MVAGVVGLISLLVVIALAVGFHLSPLRAAGQALPLTLAAALLAGFLVSTERRGAL
jgi:hypothetical protein